MGDITICTSENCPYKNDCYRQSIVGVVEEQEYFDYEYSCNENSGFESFIRNIDGGNDIWQKL